MLLLMTLSCSKHAVSPTIFVHSMSLSTSYERKNNIEVFVIFHHQNMPISVVIRSMRALTASRHSPELGEFWLPRDDVRGGCGPVGGLPPFRGLPGGRVSVLFCLIVEEMSEN